MVDIRISYFYKIRFFDPNMVPLSTAVWDPKWYSDNKEPYFDKRGILNGMRIESLVPGPGCCNLCHGTENCITRDPLTCAFLAKYREQLDNINFDEFIHMLERTEEKLKPVLHQEEIIFVLIVYEPPTKPCSERVPLIAWFKDHGYDLKEVCVS